MEMDPSIIFQNIVSYGISRENYFFVDFELIWRYTEE